MRFIGAQDADQPWFFSLNCYDPHHPFDPPEEYLERYRPILDRIPLPDYVPGELESKSPFQQRDHEGAYDTRGDFRYDDMTDDDHRWLTAAYWAMVDQIDDNVGRIVSFLKRIGQYDDTIIIFTSDHGEALGDHGMYLKGPYLYENAVHIPFIVRWAGHTTPGTVRGALCEMVDVAPTLCEAAGIEAPASFQGRSILKLITDSAAPDRHRLSVYSEYYNSNINHRNPKAFLTMVCDGRWKLVKVHSPDGQSIPGSELYDLDNDPGEHDNLYGKEAFREQQLRMLELLADRMAQTLDPLPERKAFW